MKSEDDPISDDEWLIRRVFHDRMKNPPKISKSAFEPRLNGNLPDVNGISLFRIDCLPDPKQILQTVRQDKQPFWGIVKLRVAEIRALNLSIAQDRIPEIPGHVLLPFLCCERYRSDKPSCVAMMKELAKFASEEGNIVHLPDSMQG